MVVALVLCAGALVGALKYLERDEPILGDDIVIAAPDVGFDVPDIDIDDLPDVDLPDVDSYQDGDGYEFIARNLDGSPVRYDPCSEIPYVVNPGNGPGNAVELVAGAMRRVEVATGLEFRFEGTNSQLPNYFSLQLLGDDLVRVEGHPVVWIGWTTVESTDLLPDDHHVAGVGGSLFDNAARVINRGEYSTGQVILDGDSGASPDFGSGFSEGNLLLHEIGHLVGLDHVDDPNQIMFPSLGDQGAGYQSGDLEGLGRLGMGGCL